MKKLFRIFLIILSFVILSACSFSKEQVIRPDDYKPIPASMSKQYKQEMEQIIDKEYIPIRDEINQIAFDAETMYKKVLQDKTLYMEFCNKNFDMNIYTPEFYLYSNLITITRKYTIINDENLATDSASVLYDFLFPYLFDNNIKIDKLNKLAKLSHKQYLKIDKYYQKAHKFVYPNEN